MRKFKLDLDQLHVDTFDTHPEATGERGTVEGYRVRAVTYGSCWQSCDPDDTCPGCTQTCGETCPETCAATCPETCAYSCDGNCGGGGDPTGPFNTDQGT